MLLAPLFNAQQPLPYRIKSLEQKYFKKKYDNVAKQ
jgi:hypothetical protein